MFTFLTQSFKIDQMNITKHIPNTMTCIHLTCGCLGIINVFDGDLITASIFMGIAGVFDFFDGFIARLLHVSSPMGKELDSLCDMVTFGALPAFIMLHLLESSCIGHCSTGLFGFHKPYIALIIAIFSALRLAKFNIDTRQSDSFIGVPTPANALVIASIPLISKFQPEYATYMLNYNVLLVYTVVMSYLLVAELPLMAFKFKSFAWAANKVKFIFLICSVILLILLKFVAVPLIVLLYILISIVQNFSKANNPQNQ